MINKYCYKELTWIDLESPTREEVKSIMDEYAIDPLIAQELLTPSIKPKIEIYPRFIYFVLHVPALKHSHNIQVNQEIDFILGCNFIITTHYDNIDPLHKFSRVFEVNTILDKAAIGKHAGYIFYYMFKRIYAGLNNELESLDDSLREIEKDIFEDREKEMVIVLSNTSRNLLDFKLAISHHKEILSGLESISDEFFNDKGFSKYVKSLLDEFTKIHDTVRSQSELLTELRVTNDSLLTTKQDETMKTFTVLAFVTFPISLAVSLLTINSQWNPIYGHPYDFWIILGIAVMIVFVLLIFFKHKKWL